VTELEKKKPRAKARPKANRLKKYIKKQHGRVYVLYAQIYAVKSRYKENKDIKSSLNINQRFIG
jgi:hypothetical protein